MKGCAWVLDAITALFVLLTIAVVAFVALLIAYPRSSLNPFPQPTPISLFVLPTDLPTWTPAPSATPAPPTGSATPTATATATATFTPSVTPLPSATPVIGAASPTPPRNRPSGPTATFAPPSPTASGFQYIARPTRYDANKTSEGCKWSSIAGMVVDAAGKPVSGIAISVQGGSGTIDETQYSGSEKRFGEGGFEIFLGSQPRADDYTLTVLGKTGAPLSAAVTVRTRTGCAENVVLVTFVQTR
jgi:hypothetical protein